MFPQKSLSAEIRSMPSWAETNFMIKTTNLTKTYGKGKLEFKALKDINLEIKDGEFIAIIGPSGAGKSTLLYQLSLLDDPTSGEIIFDEIETSGLNQSERTELRLHRMGFVFQDYALLPELNALENVALPILMQEVGKDRAFERANDALMRIGIAEKAFNLPSELSGGQQQRVSIARSIAHKPHVLFADEPTANLDSTNGDLVMKAFEALHIEGQTIVMVTHEKEYARHAHRIISLKDGEVVSDERR